MESKRNRTAGGGIETQYLAAVVQKVTLKSSDRFVGGHVKLNVGGRFFCTTIDTLTKIDETMLSAMFSGRMELPVDAEGWVFIDRSGKHFDTILNYLRDGDVPLLTSKLEVSELLAEAKYYCIASLVAVCEEHLNGLKKSLDIPKARLVLLSSAREWDRLLRTSSKPIVRLIVCPKSDAKISSNTNLFNRYTLEWNKDFLFVYDAITAIKRLEWRFYKSGRQFLKVNCYDCYENGYTFSELHIYECLLKTLRYSRSLNGICSSDWLSVISSRPAQVLS